MNKEWISHNDFYKERIVATHEREIENLKCCGNCGSNIRGLGVCSVNKGYIPKEHLYCDKWIYDGKIKEERKG